MANELMNRRNRNPLDRFNDWFNDDFFGFPRDDFANVSLANIMQSDIAETDKEYVVKIDMPGMQKDKINLNYQNGVLSVSGSRESFSDLSDKDGNIIHNERSIGHVSRKFRLPDVEKSAISAKYEGGVLTVTLPKATEKSDDANQIKID